MRLSVLDNCALFLPVETILQPAHFALTCHIYLGLRGAGTYTPDSSKLHLYTSFAKCMPVQLRSVLYSGAGGVMHIGLCANREITLACLIMWADLT